MPEPVGGASVARWAVPVAASDDAVHAPRRTAPLYELGRRPVTRVPPETAYAIDGHVPRVLVHRRRRGALLPRLAHVAQARIESPSPGEPASVHSPRRLLPLLLARQPVILPVARRPPLAVADGVMPRDRERGMARVPSVPLRVHLRQLQPTSPVFHQVRPSALVIPRR